MASFRRSALLFVLMALPVLLLWLWEGGYLFSIGSLDPQLSEQRLVALHRLTGWALPVLSSMILAYGISQTEPDPRFAALGRQEVRRLWLRRWMPMIALIVGIVALISWVLSGAGSALSGRVVTAAVTATLFSLSLAFAVVIRTGASPSGATALVLVLLIPAMLAPVAGFPAHFSISPAPLGWLRAAGLQRETMLHSLGVFLGAGAILMTTLLIPQDSRRLGWISRFGRKSDA